MTTIFEQLAQFLEKMKGSETQPLVVILGPTASGKTALSLEIAKLFHGEIISADSRQIYRYMDIGTDKIPIHKRQGIQHHLIDILEPDQEFTVADFKRIALKIIREILSRRKLPIVAGGTGLYLNALLQNYQIPPVPPQHDLRRQLYEFCQTNGAEALYQILKEKDPAAAARIHPNNARYVIRALEINLVGNIKKQDQKGQPLFEPFIICIEWPREMLYERINNRLDELLAQGFLNEVKTLLMKGYDEKLPALSSIGYQELIDFLHGNILLREAVENIKKNTRNYAKRQLTWFRRYKDVHWLEGEELEALLAQSEKVVAPFGRVDFLTKPPLSRGLV